MGRKREGRREEEERRGMCFSAPVNRIIQMTWCYNIGLREGNNIKLTTDRSLSLVMDTSIAPFGLNGDPSFRPSKRASRNHSNSKGVDLKAPGVASTDGSDSRTQGQFPV
jgi:hypothetical protein